MRVLVTEHSLPVIRRRLRVVTGAKSAHVAEALASALGHGTNAALIAYLNGRNAWHPGLEDVDPGAFRVRLRELSPSSDVSDATVRDTCADVGMLETGDGYEERLDDVPDVDIVPPWHLEGATLFAALSYALTFGPYGTAKRNVSFHEAIRDGLGNDPSHLTLLAACWHARRGVDPEISRFMVATLLAVDRAVVPLRTLASLNGSAARDRAANEAYREVEWACDLWRGFDDRIAIATDLICVTCPEGFDLKALPVPELKERSRPAAASGPRYPDAEFAMVEGTLGNAVTMRDLKTDLPCHYAALAGGALALSRVGVGMADVVRFLNDGRYGAAKALSAWCTVRSDIEDVGATNVLAARLGVSSDDEFACVVVDAEDVADLVRQVGEDGPVDLVRAEDPVVVNGQEWALSVLSGGGTIFVDCGGRPVTRAVVDLLERRRTLADFDVALYGCVDLPKTSRVILDARGGARRIVRGVSERTRRVGW